MGRKEEEQKQKLFISLNGDPYKQFTDFNLWDGVNGAYMGSQLSQFVLSIFSQVEHIH